jgi:hypothetical protein
MPVSVLALVLMNRVGWPYVVASVVVYNMENGCQAINSWI